MCAFYIVVFFVGAQSLFQFAGIPFPDSMIRNNPGYAITNSTFGAFGVRNSGTFTEPSIAGAFLLFCCVGFTSEYLDGKRSAAAVLIALAASDAVASSGSLFTLALFLLALVICHSPFRFPWYVNVRQARKLAWILLLLVTPPALILFAPATLRELLIALTVAKGDSSSFFNRTAADLYALQLLAQTHGLGVGLGSNRASSLAPYFIEQRWHRGDFSVCHILPSAIFKPAGGVRLASVGRLRTAFRYVYQHRRCHNPDILDCRTSGSPIHGEPGGGATETNRWGCRDCLMI